MRIILALDGRLGCAVFQLIMWAPWKLLDFVHLVVRSENNFGHIPSRPIEKGQPGPGLLAHVLVDKYSDHLPLYRRSQIFKREGADLDRSTLAAHLRPCGWASPPPCWNHWPKPLSIMCWQGRRSSRVIPGEDAISRRGKNKDRTALGLCP